MPRIARAMVEGCVYHVLNRGNSKQEIFHKDQDYKIFIDLIKEAKRRHPVSIFAYCVMPSHFHFVLRVIDSREASKYMHWLLTTHVRKYHSYYKTSGHLWQGRFKDFLIQEETHLLIVLRYVEGNPVRAGLVGSAKDWRWSSHLERTSANSFGMIDELPIELPKDWSGYVDEPLTEKEIEMVRQSVNRGAPCGDVGWQLAISKKLGLESTLRSRGRPAKKKGTVPFFLKGGE